MMTFFWFKPILTFIASAAILAPPVQPVSWWTADSGVSLDSNGKVVEWSDRTGGFQFSQKDISLAPALIKAKSNADVPVIYFDRSGQGQALALPGAPAIEKEFTVFVVFSVAAVDGDTQFLLDAKCMDTTRRGFNLSINSRSELRMNAISSLEGSPVDPQDYTQYWGTVELNDSGLDRLQIAMAQVDRDGSYILRLGDVFFNGKGKPPTSFECANALMVGAGASVRYPFGGHVAAVLIYDSALSDGEGKQVYDYLEKIYLQKSGK